METTKNRLTPFAQQFFDNLKAEIGEPLYFYGSVQRPDYIYGYSDIDVDIFAPNVPSMKFKLSKALQMETSQFHKFVLTFDKHLVTGYKINVNHPEHNFRCEICLIDAKQKKLVLYERRRKFELPLYITACLILLKWMFYVLGIVPLFVFKSIKNKLINLGVVPISDYLAF